MPARTRPVRTTLSALSLTALFAAFVAAGSLASTPVSLAAEPVTVYVKMNNRATGKIIDGMGRTSNGADAAQYTSSDSYNQQWVIARTGDHVRVKNRATGLYLDGMGRTSNGASVAQYTSSDSHTQQWAIESAGDHVRVKNRATGLYLDGMGRTSNGASVAQYTSSGSHTQQWSVAEVGKILLDGNDIRADNVNGLTFKGFGLLSANSTSALLMDYKSEHPRKYAELLQVLFGGKNPVLTNVKIEMGNDRNNSTGPDPATMRWESEAPNVRRDPGFQLAADAKKVNPDIKVSLLRWNAPAWANSNEKVYIWYKKTILEAHRTYGFMVDYVNPGLNEHAPDLPWTKQYAQLVKTDAAGFANRTEQALYNRIRVVISDEVGVGTFGGAMAGDAGLRDAVAVAGYHYNPNDDSAGNFKRLAQVFDKEVWNSEAQATFSNSAFRPNNNMKDPTVAGTGMGGTGSALEMGNTIIKGFTNSNRTNFIYQPAIGSFYEGGQYAFKELVGARDPWSGWIHYDAGIHILRHFSWFAKTGWENASNTAGIWRAVPRASQTGAAGTNPVNGRNGTPSYLTLAAPDRSDFSTVFMNDSEYTQTHRIQTVNMGYRGTPALELWETRAAERDRAFNANYMKYLGNVSAGSDGVYTVTVKPYSVVTVTTLANHTKSEYKVPLPVEGKRTVLDTNAAGSGSDTKDDTLYADDFDYSRKRVPVIGADGKIIGTEAFVASRGGSKSTIPLYTSDRNGAFEAYRPDGSANYVLRQQLDQKIMGLGGAWNGGDPVTRIGDSRWLNYKADIDVSAENGSLQDGKNYAALGVRQQHGDVGAPYKLKFWFDGGWQLLVNNSVAAGGNVVSGSGGVRIPGFKAAHDAWHNIAIEVAGHDVKASLDGVTLTTFTDPAPKLAGRIEIGSGYYHTRFDNLRVGTVKGFAPYYVEFLDNLEMNDLAAVPATRLAYSGPWAHETGKGMYIVQRTLSTSQGSGSTLSYTFKGTGLDIMGPNNGSANLEVTVDGRVVDPSARTMASPEFYQTLTLRGLRYAEHTIQIKVLNGTLAVDAVGVVGKEWVEGTGDGSGGGASPSPAPAPTRSVPPSTPAPADTPDGGDGGLPVTGAQITLFAGVGLALVGLGVLLYVIGRRRRTVHVGSDDS